MGVKGSYVFHGQTMRIIEFSTTSCFHPEVQMYKQHFLHICTCIHKYVTYNSQTIYTCPQTTIAAHQCSPTGVLREISLSLFICFGAHSFSVKSINSRLHICMYLYKRGCMYVCMQPCLCMPPFDSKST